MTPFEVGIDPELYAEFIDEALDGMAQISDLFVQLEADPGNARTIEAIFRPIHSIKGNSAFFGLMKTKILAHEMETLLDRIRKGGIAASTSIIDLLLTGSDALSAMLQRARRGEEEVRDPEAFEALVASVVQAAEGEQASENALWQSLLTALGGKKDETLRETVRKLAMFSAAGRTALVAGTQERESAGEIPQAAARLLTLLSDTSHAPRAEELLSLFAACRDLAAVKDAQAHADQALAEIPLLDKSIGLGDEISRESLSGHLHAMTAAGAWTPSEKNENPQAPPLPRPSAELTPPKEEHAQATGKTMRIPEERIDAFLSYVGDLVTLGEMYRHLQARVATLVGAHGAAMELRRANEAFASLSMALQNSIMAIRKVAMKTLLQRTPRLVRDIATASGKDIETEVIGGEILVDKSLIDTFEAPLTHMVRNAADHGIEKPQDRQQAGKPERGLIRIAAAEAGEDILLTVQDDGKGLDLEALRKKAVELGLIAPGEQLSESGLVDLLFRSGVSTAETVSEFSGRGVGMDVVKTAIEQMGGRISVSTVRGKGCTFEIRLPKTVNTQILTGFIVVIGGRRYVFPLESIVRCFCPGPGDIVTIPQKGRCVLDRGRWVRTRRLTECFHTGPEKNREAPLPEGILVVVESESRRLAVHVDAIEGVQKMVLKEIQGLSLTQNFFAGGALMGDGSVAMIIHVPSITAPPRNS